MGSFNITSQDQAKAVLHASAHIYNHNLSFINSMALKCAVHLGIADAIQKHGKPISVNELAEALDIHPTKTCSLPRLMRLLCHNNFFSKHELPNGEIGFGLTLNSQLLLKDHPLSHAPLIIALQNQVLTESAHHFETWFKTDAETPFHVAHDGRSLWEYFSVFPEFSDKFNKAMASDATLVASLLMAHDETNGIFKGVKSLVDVGGGNGAMAKAIAKAYPHIKCVVLDLPHVVNGLQGDGDNLVYVPGDMFAAIPPTQVVLLKWILHDWSDEHCLKILQRCKEAISIKDQEGKVVIIDIVMDEENNAENVNTQFLFDLRMMSNTIGGKQRTEKEWNKLFSNAGFTDYKIFHVLGLRSVIEIYPS